MPEVVTYSWKASAGEAKIDGFLGITGQPVYPN